MQPRPVGDDLTTVHQFVQQTEEGRALQRCPAETSQTIPIRTKLIGLQLMEPPQVPEQRRLHRVPTLASKQQRPQARLDQTHIRWQHPRIAWAVELALQALWIKAGVRS